MFTHSPFATSNVNVKIPSARRRILKSVFPTAGNDAPTTRQATPISSQTPSQSQHSSFSGTPQPSSVLLSSLTPQDHFTKFHPTWHLATSFLTYDTNFFDPSAIPDVAAANNILALRKAAGFAAKISEATRYLNSPEVRALDLRGNNEGLYEWYSWETQRHFTSWAKQLLPPRPKEHYKVWLDRSITLIVVAHTIYVGVLREFVLVGLEDTEAQIKAKGFCKSLNSTIGFNLPEPAWSNAVHETWLRLCAKILGVPGVEELDKAVAFAREPKKVKKLSRPSRLEIEGIEDGAGSLPSLTQSLDLGLEIEKKCETAREDNLDRDADVPPGSISDSSSQATVDDGEQKPYFKVLYPTPKQFKAKSELLKMWGTFQLLGLGGSGRKGERIFAEVIYKLLNTYITNCYATKWESPSTTSQDLFIWIDEGVTKLVKEILGTNVDVDVLRGTVLSSKRILTPRESFKLSAVHEQISKRKSNAVDISFLLEQEQRVEDQVVRSDDVDSWKQMAINKLGSLRVGELFDIVIDWPDSLGGIEDLKAYIATPESRLHLSNTFNEAMNTRLLHPGAPTADILRVYISLIKAFSVLDPRGVLLDRCSRNIKRYLKERDDTLKIIVRGMFGKSATGDGSSPDDVVLSDLAEELREFVPGAPGTGEADDYEDVNWVPDPVDAASDFRKTRGSDVIGSLLDLYENKEPLIKEIMTYLATRLLNKEDDEMEDEIRTLELLKLRIPESTLQACDVMVKDLSDSRHLEVKILPTISPTHKFPAFSAKVLSPMYWPRLKTDNFNIPPVISTPLTIYSNAFSELHPKRRISWLHGEGHITATIELSDRTVRVENARPAYITFIYAFASPTSTEVTLTQSQLSDQLSMDPTLVAKAANYWRNKGVLSIAGTSYTVIETKPATPPLSPTKHHHNHYGPLLEASHQEDEPENTSTLSGQEKQMYTQYIVTMLTNGNKAMTTGEIYNFLNLLIPGGVACPQMELAQLLGELKENGVVREGETWRVRN